MTRREQLEHYKNAIFNAEHYGREVMVMEHDPDFAARSARHAVHAAGVALDIIAALEQQAITAYLADVPLPEGWREDPRPYGLGYFDEDNWERVLVHSGGVSISNTLFHWPAIPQAVLLRAAVQCGRFREGK